MPDRCAHAQAPLIHQPALRRHRCCSNTAGVKPDETKCETADLCRAFYKFILKYGQGEILWPVQRYSIHDFLVTGETRLAHLGFNQEVRDAVLSQNRAHLQLVESREKLCFRCQRYTVLYS